LAVASAIKPNILSEPSVDNESSDSRIRLIDDSVRIYIFASNAIESRKRKAADCGADYVSSAGDAWNRHSQLPSRIGSAAKNVIDGIGNLNRSESRLDI